MLARGSRETMSLISGWTLTLGFKDQPVWKMSLGRALAIAPTKVIPEYSGGEE